MTDGFDIDDLLPERGDDNYRVPDVLGEIVGWRAWYVRKFGSQKRLASLMTMGIGLRQGVASTWKPNQWYEALCLYNPDHNGSVPVFTCTCGVYAARSLEHLLRLGYNGYTEDRVKVVGQIALVGKVIVADQGWRGEKARPVRLWVPHSHWKVARELEDTYGIAVELDNLFDPKIARQRVREEAMSHRDRQGAGDSDR